MTIREQLIAAFDKLGAARVDSRSTKYVVYSHNGHNYYIGKAGALRVGRTAADSIPTERFKRHLLGVK